MRQRNRLIINSLATMSSRVVVIASRFLIVPFAIGVLGRGHYGTWIVVGQIFAYTQILEIGLRSAVTRQVALRHERGETEELDRCVNTACAYYTAVGVAIAVMTVVIAVFFPDWFHVEPAYHTSSRVMVLCAGLGLALAVPQYAYGSVLSGLQRFDLISATQIVAEVLRLVLIFTLLGQMSVGGGLVLLAAAAGGCNLLAATAKTIVSLRIRPLVRFEPWRPDMRLLWSMGTFGLGSVVYMMSVMVAVQLASVLIAARMSTAQAADFHNAMLLIMAVHAFVIACTVGIRPAASKYDGQGNTDMLKHLLLRSTRYVSVLTFMGLMVLFVFPETILYVWLADAYTGPEGAAAIARISRTCRTLAVGFGLFWLMLPAYSVVNGLGRYKLPAILAVAAGALAMALVAVLACTPDATIDRVAWGVVLPMLPVWGGIMLWYCCRQTGQPIGSYAWQGFAVPALGCLPAGLVGFILNRYFPASTLWGLIGQFTCCGLVLLPFAWFGVFAAHDRSQVIASLRTFFRRIRRV